MAEVQQYIDFGLEKLNQIQANVQANVKNVVQDNAQYIDYGLEKLNQIQANVKSVGAAGIDAAESAAADASQFGVFLSWVLALWAVRVVILKILLKMSRSEYAENFRITKRPAITGAQLERESVWKYGYFYDTVVLCGMYYFGLFHDLPLFNAPSIVLMLFLHATVVEFVYYWFHRALHWSWIYKNFHQYHHKSINTEPTTALSFEIAERLSYTFLFAVAPTGAYLLGHQSVLTFCAYFVWFDIMNEGGHINFEVAPEWFHRSVLRYIIYTPSFHAVHHTKFKKNFSLFMPWTDILFGTAIYSSNSGTDSILPITKAERVDFENQQQQQLNQETTPDVLLLVHAGYLASALYSKMLHPTIINVLGHQKHLYEHKFWMYLMYPYLLWGLFTWSLIHALGYFTEEVFPVFARTPKNARNENDLEANAVVPFSSSSSSTDSLVSLPSSSSPPSSSSSKENKPVFATTWVVLNFGFQYLMPIFANLINRRIQNAIVDAHDRGIKVVGLGNFNKAEWLNKGGADYVDNLEDRIKGTYITHGDTLCAAVIVHHCLEMRRLGYWNRSVFLTGSTSKIGRAVALSLARHGIHVHMLTQCKPRFDEIASEAISNPLQRACLHYAETLSEGADCDLWLTGKMIPYGRELLDAIPRNALVMNFSVPDPLTPSLLSRRPDLLHLDTSLMGYDDKLMKPQFTWLLPQGLIYACLGGALVHAALNIQKHEVGPVNIDDMDELWAGAQSIGFFLPKPTSFYYPIELPTPRNI